MSDVAFTVGSRVACAVQDYVAVGTHVRHFDARHRRVIVRAPRTLLAENNSDNATSKYREFNYTARSCPDAHVRDSLVKWPRSRNLKLITSSSLSRKSKIIQKFGTRATSHITTGLKNDRLGLGFAANFSRDSMRKKTERKMK